MTTGAGVGATGGAGAGVGVTVTGARFNVAVGEVGDVATTAL